MLIKVVNYIELLHFWIADADADWMSCKCLYGTSAVRMSIISLFVTDCNTTVKKKTSQSYTVYDICCSKDTVSVRGVLLCVS